MDSSERLEQLYNSLADVERAHSEASARIKELAPGARRSGPAAQFHNGPATAHSGGPPSLRRDARGMGTPGAGLRGPMGPRGRGGIPVQHLRRGPAFGDLAERRGLPPRSRRGPQEDQPPPPRPSRLASAIVVDGGVLHDKDEEPEDGELSGRWDGSMEERSETDHQQPKSIRKRPALSDLEEAPDMKKRNRRMFGALLGTLQRFRKDDAQQSEIATKRAEMLKKVAEKAEAERTELRQKEKEEMTVKRAAEIRKRKELSLQAALVRIEINFHRRVDHRTKLSHFIFTKTEPPLLWLPKKPSEGTDKLIVEQKSGLNDWVAEEKSKMETAQAEVEVKLAQLKQDAALQAGTGADDETMEVASKTVETGQSDEIAADDSKALAASNKAGGQEEEDDDDMVQEEDPEGLADVLG